MKTRSILAVSLICLGLNVTCSQNYPPSANSVAANTEKTEQEKLDKDIAWRNETEAKMMKGSIFMMEPWILRMSAILNRFQLS